MVLWTIYFVNEAQVVSVPLTKWIWQNDDFSNTLPEQSLFLPLVAKKQMALSQIHAVSLANVAILGLSGCSN